MTLDLAGDLCGTTSCGAVSGGVKAGKVCDQLGIRHYVKNASALFRANVVDRFVNDYLSGLTPNPCVECNRFVKISYLMELAAETGADFFATGHYARILKESGGLCRLSRGLDASKDQSYFLYCINKEKLPRIIFPLGDLEKRTVRAEAAKLGLHTASEKDSHDVCFVTEKNYADFVFRYNPEARQMKTCGPGDIVNSKGETVGRHEGLINYTVGQRHGIRVAFPDRTYVTRLVPSLNRIVIGKRAEAMSVK